ncbi:MAG: two-component system phosphate regulon sensor histidine kinase PhoR [Candidatus Paceibacteria bacterium]|jgi:two-component system phosphate regulon sensor histidine kinase PhoR
MPSITKIKSLRFFERTLLIFLGISVSVSAWMSASGKLGEAESLILGGIVLFMLAVLFFLQHKIDGWQSMTISQSSFVQDEALAVLFDRSPLAYLIIQTNGIIDKSNPAAVNLLQGMVDEMGGLNFFNLIQTSTETDENILKSKVEAGLMVNDVEVSLETILGETIWVLLTVGQYQNLGQRLVSLVDVTEQKHVDTAKSEFVALATHQLRTPIAAIRWNVELLQKNLKDTETPDQARYIDKIERNVLRMVSLINDFLSVSKLEMGTFASKEENINISNFLSAITDEFSEKITEKQLVLKRQDIPPQVTIKIDSRLLHIIVSNLVSNSVKYLKSSGELELSYELRDGQVQIVVADNGIGIPESEIPKLFTKFFRASNAQSHQTEGTGLGLYVVKQSAELLNGSITVESGEDKGAKFVVSLPVTVVEGKEIG